MTEIGIQQNKTTKNTPKYISTRSKTEREEKPKQEYMNTLLEIIEQQTEHYKTRFQSGDKKDIDKMLEGLENYPVYSLHRQRSAQSQRFGIIYAKELNKLIAQREALEKKKKALTRFLARKKLENKGNDVGLYYDCKKEESETLKPIEDYESELTQLTWARDKCKYTFNRIKVI